MDITRKLAEELSITTEQVEKTIALMDEGATIPFIARYRKEVTGSLDDQVLRQLDTRLKYLRNLENRKAEIQSAIEGQGKWTPELAEKLDQAETLVEAEDIYLPFKPKRKTRASVAASRGLTPLADLLWAQDPATDPEKEAEAFVDPEKEVPSVQAALQGAMDILAENVSTNADLRKQLRRLCHMLGTVVTRVTNPEKDPDHTYQNYYEYSEAVRLIANHRVLAIDRAEREGVLKVQIQLPTEHGLSPVYHYAVRNDSAAAAYVRQAAEDGYTRLLYPAVEREVRKDLTAKADTDSIQVFSSNLREILMAAPLKNRVVLGLDPGYRTGCKLAVVDETGKVLDTGVAYITVGEGARMEQGKARIREMMVTHHATVVAIGNGTASREAEQVTAEILRTLPYKAEYMVVSEAGASVYSASPLGAEEFPEYDVSLRSAVSIARRLQDPLAELVKIDPKAIGVGQYQHDMPEAELSQALDGVVEDCVNRVGVDVNTASYALLSRVAGISPSVAKNIVAYRTENGKFRNRTQLKKVPRLGAKAFEQCAGFLRIDDGDNPLDNTAVHPESYAAAKAILQLCGIPVEDLTNRVRTDLTSRVQEMGVRTLADKVGIGEPTCADIVEELSKPGRDPRDELPPPLLRSGDVMTLEDLKPGMELMGTVRNVVDFGCFVDIGVHEDGLVHISQMSDKFVKNPLDIVHTGDVVKVRVLDVDVPRKRISLTMKPEKVKKI